MAKRTKQTDLLGLEEPQPQDEFFGDDPPPAPAKGSAQKTPAAAENPLEPEAPVARAPKSEGGYVVLARRYRPQTFDEIVGQENVQKALRGAIETGQIGHAYLFSGPRGTGKTSTARILAKAVNCLEGGPRPDPCGRCASCRAIAAGSSLDVIEIDAASNTGVDNIRELRSGVVLAPFSRFKVYIVDEVHMLSNQAFNALLKTLEEPPSQVIFVLATTDPQKVPETIVSRCQPFGFRRFTTAEIVGQLDRILTTELKRRKLSVADEDRAKILDLVARNAEGGMRDAQVALDQVLVFSHGKLDFESVRRFLGAVDSEVLDDFVRAVSERRTEDLLSIVDELRASGQDLELFVRNVSHHVRDLLILRSAPERPELVNAAPDRHRSMIQLADDLSPSFLVNLAGALIKLSEEMKGSSQTRFLVEFALIRLTKVDPIDDISKILSRLQEVEKHLSGRGPVPPPSGPAAGAPSAAPRSAGTAPQVAAQAAGAQPPQTPAPQSIPTRPGPPRNERIQVAPAQEEVPPQALASDLPVIAQFQRDLLARLHEKNLHGLQNSLLECGLVSLNDTGFCIGVPANDRYTLSHLDTTHNQNMLRTIAREITGRDLPARLQPVRELTNPFRESSEASSSPGPELPKVLSAAAQPSIPAAISSPAPVDVKAAESRDAELPPDESERVIEYSPELRELTKVTLKGQALKKLLEANTDLAELIDKAKALFQIDDSNITVRAPRAL